ncbi:MAG: aminoglycoside phosphotransferase family protein [Pseudomonadota bacterium]
MHDDWRERAEAVLRGGEADGDETVLSGEGGTFPVFMTERSVIKIYDPRVQSSAPETYDSELHALTQFADDPEIRTPHLIDRGAFGRGAEASPYIVMSRIPGAPWREVRPSPTARAVLAADLGRCLSRIHTRAEMPSDRPWALEDAAIIAAMGRSSVPRRLFAGIPDFLDQYGDARSVALVHGDLMDLHVFVEASRVTGIIDWGDAMVADRTFEFAKLHLDLFEADKTLFDVALSAYGWDDWDDFAPRCLAQAILRQAHCCAQHGTCDVFHKVPSRFDMRAAQSLPDLADILFSLDR